MGCVFMFRGYNLRQRIVIDAATAERIGVISDVEIDETSGVISRIIIKRRNNICGGFFGMGEISVPWSAIAAVGREFVLIHNFEKLV